MDNNTLHLSQNIYNIIYNKPNKPNKPTNNIINNNSAIFKFTKKKPKCVCWI